jgi:hypothetical protein
LEVYTDYSAGSATVLRRCANNATFITTVHCILVKTLSSIWVILRRCGVHILMVKESSCRRSCHHAGVPTPFPVRISRPHSSRTSLYQLPSRNNRRFVIDSQNCLFTICTRAVRLSFRRTNNRTVAAVEIIFCSRKFSIVNHEGCVLNI